MKIAIISASIGIDFEIPKALYPTKADYYLFTDKLINPKESAWKIKKPVFKTTHVNFKNRRNAKVYKILPEYFIPNYDYYIWHDITHYLKEDPEITVLSNIKKSDFAVFRHRFRKDVITEAKFVKKIKYDEKNLLNSQIKEYKKQMNLEGYGLYELPSFIKKNTNISREFSLSWWEQICKYSSRDQISFPYICSKMNIMPDVIKGDAFGKDSSRYFEQFYFSEHSRI